MTSTGCAAPASWARNTRSGSHGIVAIAPGGASVTAAKVETGAAEVELVIEATASIAGRILIDQGDLPSMFEIAATGPGRQRIAEAFVSGDGRWWLDGLAPGPVRISAVTSLGRASADLSIAAGEHRDGVELQLVGRVDLAGQLVDLETGQPLEGFTVVATAHDDGWQELGKAAEIAAGVGPADPRQVTGEDGRFVVPSVSVGLTNLAAIPKGFPDSSHDSVVTTLPVPFDDALRLPARTLPLAPNGKPGRAGLEIEGGAYDEPLTIERVSPSGPAAALGIEPNDTIVAIDGHEATGVYKYLGRVLHRAPPDTTVSLTLGRGPTVELTLR